MNIRRILSVIASGLLLLSGPVSAQTPFCVYEGAKTEAEPHVFSSEAVTIPLEKGVNLLPLYFRNGGTDTLSSYSGLPSVRTANYPLGFDMPFGEKTVRYFGFTGGGCVYFGETDSLRPVSNPWGAFTYSSSSLIDGYAMFRPCIWGKDVVGNPRITGDAQMTAGEEACIRFEVSGNTLYIAYTNILLGQLPLSFQYAFEKNGVFSLIPVSMKPEPENSEESYFALGLMGNTLSGSVFIGDYDGGTKTGGYPKTVINAEVHPETGYAYSLMPPDPCQAVSQAEIKRWGYETGDTTLKVTGAMSWPEGDAALFILSKSENLTGEDLPQDGTVYKAGDRIGGSCGLLIGSVIDISPNYFSNFVPNTLRGLEPYTQYYLHAFPYSTACTGGPAYNTAQIPVEAVKTYPLPPAFLRLKDSSLTRSSFSVEIDNGQHYLLASSPIQLASGTHINLNGIYTEGQTIPETGLTVVRSDADTSVIAFSGYEAGSDVYLYAWRNMDGGEAYSKYAAACGISTVHTLPCSLNFNSAAASDDDEHPAPAGWSYEPDNTHIFHTAENSSLGKYIYTIVGVRGSGKTARTAVVSPIIERGSYQKAAATINLYFWYEDNGSIGSRIPSGDSLLIQYRNLDGESTWQNLDVVTSASAFSSGRRNHTTPFFSPGAKFQFRFVLVSAYNLDAADAKANFAAIYGLSVEPELNCKAVSGLTATEITTSSCQISWKDDNTAAAISFELRYRQDSASDPWSTPVTVQQPLHLWTDLQSGTPYITEVKAVCKAGDTSLAETVGFTTLLEQEEADECPAPTNLSTSHLTSNSVDVKWQGDCREYAVCYKVRGSDNEYDTLYSDSTGKTITGLAPQTAYEVFVIGYCDSNRTFASEPSATRYFQTLENSSVGTEIAEAGKAAVRLRPNPAADKIIVSCATGYIEEVSVLSASGLETGCRINGQKSAETVYPLGHLKSGIYFARVKTSEGTITVKFVIR